VYPSLEENMLTMGSLRPKIRLVLLNASVNNPKEIVTHRFAKGI
jgi:hypothetical protein